jgi:hypothetical protein
MPRKALARPPREAKIHRQSRSRLQPVLIASADSNVGAHLRGIFAVVTSQTRDVVNLQSCRTLDTRRR